MKKAKLRKQIKLANQNAIRAELILRAIHKAKFRPPWYKRTLRLTLSLVRGRTL